RITICPKGANSATCPKVSGSSIAASGAISGTCATRHNTTISAAVARLATCRSCTHQTRPVQSGNGRGTDHRSTRGRVLTATACATDCTAQVSDCGAADCLISDCGLIGAHRAARGVVVVSVDTCGVTASHVAIDG